ESAWRSIVLAEAEELARTLDPARVAPLRPPRRTRALAGLIAATVALLFAPLDRLRASAPAAEMPVAKTGLDAIAAAGARLRQASQGLPPSSESRKTLDDSGKKLRTFI